MNKKNIKKRDLTKIKESTIICVPSKLVNVSYKDGITKLMLHIFLYIHSGNSKELYFSTTAFLDWFGLKNKNQYYKQQEVKQIFKDWEKEGLITVLENVTNDVFKIRLEESFYVYGNDKYYKDFVTIYADEVEKILSIDCKEKKEIDSKMILFVFLYLKQYKNIKRGYMLLGWVAEDIFNKNKTTRVRTILEMLEKEEMIYYEEPTLTMNKKNKFIYTSFQYVLSYERDLKNKVEYYGEEFIKQKLKELKGEEENYE